MRKIRQASIRDFKAVLGIVSLALRGCVVDVEGDHAALCGEIAQSLELWGQAPDSGCCLVCEEGGVILGVILVKDFWNLSVLFVDPARHRLGIGRQLLAAAMEVCKDRSPKGCIQLNSSTYAVPFYEKTGFVPNGEPRDLPGGCVPFIYQF